MDSTQGMRQTPQRTWNIPIRKKLPLALMMLLSSISVDAQTCSEKLKTVTDFIENPGNHYDHIDSLSFNFRRKNKFRRMIKKSVTQDTLRYQVHIHESVFKSEDSVLNSEIGQCFVHEGLPQDSGAELILFMYIIDEDSVSLEICENSKAPDFGLFYGFTFIFNEDGDCSILFRHGSHF